jgi:hypothetical protein
MSVPARRRSCRCEMAPLREPAARTKHHGRCAINQASGEKGSVLRMVLCRCRVSRTGSDARAERQDVRSFARATRRGKEDDGESLAACGRWGDSDRGLDLSRRLDYRPLCCHFQTRPAEDPTIRLSRPRGTTRHSRVPCRCRDPSKEITSRFPLRLFMPPLRQRPIDVLALLHFFNRYMLPTHFGLSYEHIFNCVLIHMLYAEWPTNARELHDLLLASAEVDFHRVQRAKGVTLTNLAYSPLSGESRNQRFMPLLHTPENMADDLIRRYKIPNTTQWQEYHKRLLKEIRECLCRELNEYRFIRVSCG